MQARPHNLVRYYVKWSIVQIIVFQAAMNLIWWYAGLDATQKDWLMFQVLMALSSTNAVSLWVAISYIRMAEPSITLFDKAAYVLGRIFEHGELRGLTEEQAAQRITSVLDIIHTLRPTLLGMKKLQPRHIERGIHLLTLLLEASDKIPQDKIDIAFGRAVGKQIEKVLNDAET